MFPVGAGVSTRSGVGLAWPGALVGNGAEAEVGTGSRSSVGREIGVGETILPVTGSIVVAVSIDGSCQMDTAKSVTQQTATITTANIERITYFLRTAV